MMMCSFFCAFLKTGFTVIRIQANVNHDFKHLTTLALAIRTLGLLFQIGMGALL